MHVSHTMRKTHVFLKRMYRDFSVYFNQGPGSDGIEKFAAF